MWGMKQAWLGQSSPSLLSWVLVCGGFFPPFLYPPAFSSFLLLLKPLYKGFPAESSWCPVLAAFPRVRGGFHRKSMAAYFPLYCGFMCGPTWPQPYWSILQSYFHSDVLLYKRRKLVEGRCQTACHILFSICWNQVYSVLFRNLGLPWSCTMHFRSSIRQ